MKDLIACCGLDCENCDARKATLNNDDALREKTAKEWTEGVKFLYCSELCPIRKCVLEKGYGTCAECGLIDTCEVVGEVFKNAPGSRDNLMNF